MRPDPRSRGMQWCNHNATKAETQEIKSDLAAGPCGIGTIGGHANLINMVTVSAVSGTVLLGLLAAKHF
jgi:hypothetical protein